MNTTPQNSLTTQAKTAYDGEEFLEAAHLYQQAATELTASGDLQTAAEMLNNCSVAFLKAGKAKEALAAAAGTEKTFAEAQDTRREAMALGNQAAAYEDLHQYDEALTYYTRSSELFKTVGERDMRSIELKRISALQLRQGKNVESLLSMESSINVKDQPAVKDRLLRALIKAARKLTSSK